MTERQNAERRVIAKRSMRDDPAQANSSKTVKAESLGFQSGESTECAISKQITAQFDRCQNNVFEPFGDESADAFAAEFVKTGETQYSELCLGVSDRELIFYESVPDSNYVLVGVQSRIFLVAFEPSSECVRAREEVEIGSSGIAALSCGYPPSALGPFLGAEVS